MARSRAKAAPAAFTDAAVHAGVEGLHKRFLSRLEVPSRVLQRYLERIERFNPGLGAFVDLDRAGAERDARASDARCAAGRMLSALDGVPVGIKANMAVQGLPWTAGIGAWRERIAADDAPCVARLRAAGAIVLGTLNMDEGALGARTDNPWFGRTHNPHRHGHVAAGSSGGSAAAVAAGLCAAALGTDTIGSVRLPAAYCGVVGASPEPGRLDTRGVTPLSWTFDNVGVLARSVVDAMSVLRIAAGRGPARVALAAAGRNRRVAALMPPAGIEIEPAVALAFDTALAGARAAGWTVMPLRLDGLDLALAMRQLLRVIEAEAHAEHASALQDDGAEISPDFRGMLAWGARQPAGTLAAAYLALRAQRASIREQLTPFAALLTPAAPQLAFAFDSAPPTTQAAFTAIGSIAGLSGLVLPVMTSADGLPCAVQLLAAGDTTVARMAVELARHVPGVAPPARFVG